MLRKEHEFSGQSVIATSPTLREAIDTFSKRRELKQDANAIRRWRSELRRLSGPCWTGFLIATVPAYSPKPHSSNPIGWVLLCSHSSPIRKISAF